MSLTRYSEQYMREEMMYNSESQGAKYATQAIMHKSSLTQVWTLAFQQCFTYHAAEP